MRARVGRFVRGPIDEDVQGGGVDIDAVFDRDRIAEALDALRNARPARILGGTPPTTEAPP